MKKMKNNIPSFMERFGLLIDTIYWKTSTRRRVLVRSSGWPTLEYRDVELTPTEARLVAKKLVEIAKYVEKNPYKDLRNRK